MRKLAQASTALLLSGTTTAMAAGVDASFGEARLYWRTSFGEQQAAPATAQFGMSLDYDRRYLTPGQLPPQPAAQVNFDRQGLTSASLNGIPFARRAVALQQTEGEGAAAGVTYTAIDYGLLALGAVGIGYTISEVVNQKDTSDAATPATPPGTPPAQPPAGPSLPMPAGTPALPMPAGTPALPMPAGTPALPVPGAPLAGSYHLLQEREVTPEYQRWLDEGTGGMGDLLIVKD